MEALDPPVQVAAGSHAGRVQAGLLLTESLLTPPSSPEGDPGDHALAASSEANAAEGQRLIALVELARAGDAEAFGLLYDHYQPWIYRFLCYRVGSVAVAEDLTSETFL